MNFMDKIRHLVGKNSDKAKTGLDKASSFVDEKTGGRHSDKIGRARDKAHDFVDDSRSAEGGRSSEGDTRPTDSRNPENEKRTDL